MVRKLTLGATGFAIVAATFVVVACSSKTEDDDDDSGTGGKGGSAGTNSGSAGKGATAGTSSSGSAGQSTTGGTGGGGTAGTGGSAGAATGGVGGQAVAGGAGAGGAGFACTTPAVASCNSFDNWSVSTAAWFGTAPFTGGFSTYGAGLVRDTAVTDKIHITGMVSTYSGFNVWFSACSTLAAYTGVSFVIDGTSPSALTPGTLNFNPQTNSTSPYTGTGVDTSGKKGTCLPTDLANPYGSCVPPAKSITIGPTASAITWTDMETTMTGTPVKFTTAMSPGEIVGLQWQFPWGGASDTPYAVDITLDQLTFTGGSGVVDCGTMTGGGGMGAGGASAGNGGQAGGAGIGGATAGQGGAGGRGGAAGAAGAGGRGGAGGAGGRGGNGGRAGGN